MQLHDILQLRTSVILPEAISDGGLAPTTDTSLFLTTYRDGSHLPSDIRPKTGSYMDTLQVAKPMPVFFFHNISQDSPDSASFGNP